jgi:multiple sugar transport system substrate-binding protein
VRDDLTEPLDSYMSPEFKNRFIGQFLKPSQIDGKTYGLPIAASARAMFYNKAMLTEAGFPDGPKTPGTTSLPPRRKSRPRDLPASD